MSFAASARARASRLSQVTRMPSPYSALSSKSELPQATPRPSARVQYGAVGRLPAYTLEQPVAFATTRRSPQICVRRRMYGASPHPAHAPQNSKSGFLSCTSL